MDTCDKYAAMGSELIETVRNSTGLSHEQCQETLQVVLKFLTDRIENMPEAVHLIFDTLYIPNAIRFNPSLMDNSADARKLREILTKLVECKNDSQQRSWALHEDLQMISNNLEQLITILKEADHEISRRVFRAGQYGYALALVQYYQMETRWPIRKLLLETFALFAAVDEYVIPVLVNSILPMELGRELTQDLSEELNEFTVEKLLMVGQLLSMIWSTGEKMPITHFDVLEEKFLDNILDGIENPPDDDDRVTDVFMTVILSFNLQFSGPENTVIKVLSKRESVKVFTQKVVHLLNWEEDPITVLPHKTKTVNSVHKLVLDLFTHRETSSIFYTNDVKVLIDIVTRYIADLGPGDERRQYYLRLIYKVMRNTAYIEHQHRKEDLLKSFTSILTEEDKSAEADQRLVSDIMEEFPQVFAL